MRSILELVVDEQSHKLISCASEVALGEDFLIKFSGESKLLGERLIGATAMVTMTCNLDLVYRTTKEVLTCVKFDDPSALGELNVGDVYIVPDKIWTRQAARAVQNGYAQAYVGLTITYKDGRRVEFGTAITILHRGYADDGQSYLELLTDVEEHNEDELAHPKLRKLIEDEKTGLRAEALGILSQMDYSLTQAESSRDDARISATNARESAASAKDAYDKLSPALDSIDANVGKVQEEATRALNYLMDCEFLADKAAKASESAYRYQVESSRSAIDASEQNGYATEAATNASIDARQARSYSNLAEKYCNDANASKLACKNALNECNSAMFEAQDWASEASGHEVKARDYAIEDYWNKYDNKSGYVQDTSKVTAVYNEDRSRVIYTTRVALFVDPQIADINLFVRMIWIQISGYSINSSVEATDFEIVDAHTTDDKGFIGYSVVCKATFESSMGTSGTPMAILRVTSAKNYYYLMKDSTEGAIEARDEAVAAKNEAVASAMLASASASSASESASSANTSATTASASASSAVASASVATAGANTATTKANEASASASTASASAGTATAKASAASASATQAVQAATTATTKATAAATSATQAAASATQAENTATCKEDMRLVKTDNGLYPLVHVTDEGPFVQVYRPKGVNQGLYQNDSFRQAFLDGWYIYLYSFTSVFQTRIQLSFFNYYYHDCEWTGSNCFVTTDNAVWVKDNSGKLDKRDISTGAQIIYLIRNTTKPSATESCDWVSFWGGLSYNHRTNHVLQSVKWAHWDAETNVTTYRAGIVAYDAETMKYARWNETEAAFIYSNTLTEEFIQIVEGAVADGKFYQSNYFFRLATKGQTVLNNKVVTFFATNQNTNDKDGIFVFGNRDQMIPVRTIGNDYYAVNNDGIIPLGGGKIAADDTATFNNKCISYNRYQPVMICARTQADGDKNTAITIYNGMRRVGISIANAEGADPIDEETNTLKIASTSNDAFTTDNFGGLVKRGNYVSFFIGAWGGSYSSVTPAVQYGDLGMAVRSDGAYSTPMIGTAVGFKGYSTGHNVNCRNVGFMYARTDHTRAWSIGSYAVTCGMAIAKF